MTLASHSSIEEAPHGTTESPLDALNLPEGLTSEDRKGIAFLQANPNINIDIYFSEHGTASNLGPPGEYEKKVANADVYAYEANEVPRSYERMLGRLAAGKVLGRVTAPLFQEAVSSFGKRKLGAIRNSGVVPVAADVPVGHPLQKSQKARMKLHSDTIENIRRNKIQEAMESAQGYAVHNHAREWVGLGRLGSKIKELTETDPAMAEKLRAGDLNVFMTYGTFHSTMFYKLQKLGLSPTRSFEGVPDDADLDYFTYTSEGARFMHEAALALDGVKNRRK